MFNKYFAFFLFVCCCFSGSFVYANKQQVVDSLGRYSNEELLEKARLYKNSLYLDYLEAQSLDEGFRMALYEQYANLLITEGDLAKSLSYFQKLDSLAEKLQDSGTRFIAQLGMGEIYFRKKDYEASRLAFEHAKPFLESLPEGIDRILASAEYNYFYYLNGQFDQYISELEKSLAALKTYSKSSSFPEAEKNYLLMAEATVSLFLGNGYLMNESYEQAEKAIQFSKQILDTYFPGEVSYSSVQYELVLAELYFFKKDFKMAIPQFQKLEVLGKSSSFKDVLYKSRVFLSIAYYQVGDFQESLTMAEAAVNQHILLADYIDFEMEAVRYAYLSSKELGLTEKAMDYSRMFMEQDAALKDTKRSNFVNSIINNIQVSKLKEDLMASAKSNSSLRITLVGLAVFLIFLSTFTYIQIRENKRNKIKVKEFMAHLDKVQQPVRKTHITQGKTDLHVGEAVAEDQAEPDEKTLKFLEKLDEFELSEVYTDSRMSLSFLASYLGTNTITLSKLINTQKQMNFNDYINGLRIKYIIRRIKREPQFEQYKISYLAEVSGFSSHSIFSKAFKKSTGVTPSQFLEVLKESSD